jgi:hypothetical protein
MVASVGVLDRLGLRPTEQAGTPGSPDRSPDTPSLLGSPQKEAGDTFVGSGAKPGLEGANAKDPAVLAGGKLGEKMVVVENAPGDGCGCGGSCSDCGKALPQSQADAAMEKRNAAALAEVNQHEDQHMANNPYAGGKTVQQDKKTGATKGSVPVSFPPPDEKNPETTVKAGQLIRAAALRPKNPSGADHSVAGTASALESKGNALVSQKLRNEGGGAGGTQSLAKGGAGNDAKFAAAKGGGELPGKPSGQSGPRPNPNDGTMLAKGDSPSGGFTPGGGPRNNPFSSA